MIGGLLKSSSALAIVAAAGLSLGVTQAQAADLGGDCCADLEERISELEATTVRKGNRKLSMTLSGSVTEALIFWNDGLDEDKNVILPDTTGAGFSISGQGKIDADRTAGYVMALNVRQGDPNDAGNTSLQDYKIAQNISVDAQYVYLASKSLGTVSLGYRNGTYKSWNNGAFDLGGASGINDYMGGTVDLAAGLSISKTGNSWYSAIGNLGGRKDMSIRYDSPTFAGFTVSASWGGDDAASAGLAYSGKFNDTEIVAGVAYETDRNGSFKLGSTNSDKVTVGASLYNAPSGLYLTGEYNMQYDATTVIENTAVATPRPLKEVALDDASAWFIKAGWRKNVNGLGETNVYASYLYGDALTQSFTFATGAVVETTEGQAYTVGLAQDIDAVGATVFMQYDLRQVTGGDAVIGCPLNDCEDLSTLAAGMKVAF